MSATEMTVRTVSAFQPMSSGVLRTWLRVSCMFTPSHDLALQEHRLAGGQALGLVLAGPPVAADAGDHGQPRGRPHHDAEPEVELHRDEGAAEDQVQAR